MSIISRWQLGAKALDLMAAATEFIKTTNLDAVLAALLKVVELERELSGPGNGAEKLTRLLQWFVSTFPQYGYSVGVLRDFASALVGLFNVVRLFRKA